MNKKSRSPSKKSASAFTVVIGASAGGNNALVELVKQLTPDINAAYFIATHLSLRKAGEYFLSRLQKFTELPCQFAKSESTIKKHHIYLAPVGQHLILKDNKMLLGNGAPENRWRPSIDVLFRSAAATHDSRVIGIILTGMLADGAAGMSAIQRSGGACIIQNPAEAEYPDMPNAVLNTLKPDFNISLHEMGKTIAAVIKNHKSSKSSSKSIPFDVTAEARLDERSAIDINMMNDLGDQTIFSCPDCGGILWHMKNGNGSRYRCYTGHVYSEADLQLKQVEKLEDTLWVALRMMEERKNLNMKMEADYKAKGFNSMAERNRERIDSIDKHIQRLKALLFTNGKENGKDE